MAFLHCARINEALLSFTPSIPQINTVNTICNPLLSRQRNSPFFLHKSVTPTIFNFSDKTFLKWNILETDVVLCSLFCAVCVA